MGSAIIEVGPPATLDNSIALTPIGSPETKLLEVAGGSMCSRKHVAMVQRISYTLPPERQQYHGMLMSFTFQAKVQRDAQQPFVKSSYSSVSCRSNPPGVSETGVGSELILGRCPNPGEDYEGRLVRGFAGILELDDALRETTTLYMPFDAADKAVCKQLRAKADRYD